VRPEDGGGPQLDPAPVRREEPKLRLLLPDDHAGREPVLADRAAERAREAARLDGRHADLAIPFRTPRRLPRRDGQDEPAALQDVRRLRARARRPLREIGVEPSGGIQATGLEAVRELWLRAAGEGMARAGFGHDSASTT